MRLILTIVLLLGAGLAGCIGDDGATDPDLEATGTDDVQTTAKELLTMGGCSEQVGIFPLPPVAAEGYIPEGFSTVPFDPAGQTITMASVNYACQLDAEDGARPIAEGWGVILVEPTEAYTHETVDIYAVPIGGFSADEEMVATYESWGITEIVHGDVTVETVADTPAARVGQAQLTNGDQEVLVQTEVTGAVASGEAGKARFFGVQDGSIQGVVDMNWTASHSVGEGHATLVENLFLPVPHPVTTGIGVHAWGEDYDFTLWPVDLPEA